MPFKRSKVDILGVSIDDISFDEAIERILKLAQDRRGGHYVVTVNSEFIMLSRKNRDFWQILQQADLALADGFWVVVSKLIFGGKVHERIAGVDLVEKICPKSAKEAIRIGFLGGFGNVASEVAKRQKMTTPDLRVVFAQSGDWVIGSDLRLKEAIGMVGQIDILFVAFGMGRQEFWIKRNLNRVNVGVFIGVGGAFDYLAKVKLRAPRLLQKIGLEWAWRLFWEPTRIWRMRFLPIFALLVLLEWTKRTFFKK